PPAPPLFPYPTLFRSRAPSHRSASLPRRALCAAQCHLWLPTAHNCPVAAPGALAPGAGRGGGRASALLRGAGLRADEPGLLLELLEDAVQDVRRGGIGLVDLVMDGAHGAHRLLDRGGDQVDRVVREHLALRER